VFEMSKNPAKPRGAPVGGGPLVIAMFLALAMTRVTVERRPASGMMDELSRIPDAPGS